MEKVLHQSMEWPRSFLQAVQKFLESFCLRHPCSTVIFLEAKEMELLSEDKCDRHGLLPACDRPGVSFG
jgi:hypothetical protein